jgi:hypothetical protein
LSIVGSASDRRLLSAIMLLSYDMLTAEAQGICHGHDDRPS